MDHPRHDDPFCTPPFARDRAPVKRECRSFEGGLLPLRNPLRRMSRRPCNRARAVGGGDGAEPTLSPRCDLALDSVAAVLDRQERNQDDRHAVVAELTFGRPDLGSRRFHRGDARASAPDLFPMAFAQDVRRSQGPLASSWTIIHSSSRTGATDSRDCRISSIFESRGSALISRA